jgi:hypothetical protein
MVDQVAGNLKRWFSFSLRTIFVLMTALSIWLGLYVKSYRDRRNAVAEIERLDGAMGIKYFGPEWLRNIVKDEKFFWDPAGVHFNRPLTEAELKSILPHLMTFQRLHDLTLPGSTITNDNLPSLFPLASKLTYLNVAGSQISDDAIVHLKQFPKLKILRVNGTGITGAGVRELQQALPTCRVSIQ